MAKLEDRKYDLRTLERNLRKGAITKAEYEAYINGLEDITDRGVAFDASFIEGVLDEEETTTDDDEG